MLFSLLTFSSCETVAQAVVEIVLDRDKCAYAGCNRDRSLGSSYCKIHKYSTGYEIPKDIDKKTSKSINKQLEEFRESEKKLNQTQASSQN